MKYFGVLHVLLGIYLAATFVSAATFMTPRRWAIYDIQIVNTLDNCYFLYGTPMVGDSEYDDVLGAFTSDTIVWNEMCTLPWTMNEMEVFCRSFGWHTVDDTWENWNIYNSLFNETLANEGNGCDRNTDVDSVSECDLGTRRTPACSTVDGQNTFYANFNYGNFTVRPVVFCQAGADRFDPLQCMNDADGVGFTETRAWGINSVTRKKRDAVNPKHKVHISKSENDVDKVAEVFAKKERAVQNKEQRPGKNILLADPFGFKSRFSVPEDEVKDVEAFWNLMDEIENRVVGNTEDEDGDKKRRRSKRAIPADMYCGTRNVVTLYTHHTECHCKPGFQKRFCEQDIDECLTKPCGNNTFCLNSEGAYECNCLSGFEWAPNGRDCIDIDECVRGLHDCDSQQECSNTHAGFLCDCIPGYRRNTVTGICDDIDECTELLPCSHNCTNTAGGFTCTCLSGYELQRDQKSCIDVDECEDDSICNSTRSECRNKYGSYSCDCRTGFTKVGENMCEDINECINNPCTSDRSACVNTEGSYRCFCPDGQKEILGICRTTSNTKIRFPLTVSSSSNDIYDMTTPQGKALCDAAKQKGKVADMVQILTTTCEITQANQTVARKKRQADGTPILITLVSTFDGSLDLAELSQVTYNIQENLATGSQELDLSGAGLGTALITERAQLVEAEGLNLNDTGGSEITEVCYLYNLVSYCQEGSVCVDAGNNIPMCDCAEGFTGSQCSDQVVSAISTSTIFLLSALIGLFFAFLALCFSHMWTTRKLHALEKFVGYRYHAMVIGDERYTAIRGSSSDTMDRPRSWLPQPIRRHYGQSPGYFSHWS